MQGKDGAITRCQRKTSAWLATPCAFLNTWMASFNRPAFLSGVTSSCRHAELDNTKVTDG